jgi:hypothetical protein
VRSVVRCVFGKSKLCIDPVATARGLTRLPDFRVRTRSGSDGIGHKLEVVLGSPFRSVLRCVFDKSKLRIDPVATARGSDTAAGFQGQNPER